MGVKREDNTREVINAINTATNRGLQNLTNDITEEIDEGFDTGHDALGRPWTPLSPTTIRKKGHSQILVEGGTMRASLFSEVNKQEKEAEIGFKDGKIRFHEFGAPSVNLPARPVLSPAATYGEEVADWKFRESYTQTFEGKF